MSAVPSSTGLTITNPLVKYRALLAAKKICPDPAQHRLAVHLQKLYYRLKDYDPEIEYRHRLDQISRSIGSPWALRSKNDAKQRHVLTARSRFSSLWRDRRHDPVLALTRTIPTQESALSITSPQGMLLYGEVGRGKSMLIDLFADSLPSRKKKRWHFNTFMLETFRRLEQLRIQRLNLPPHLQGFELEHTVLSMAKDTIATSPILFLDEFQLPDRAASKLLSSFLTSFFHLGGVLIATSNRMPDELAQAAGAEYVPQPTGIRSVLGWSIKRSGSERAASTNFGAFLDVLKARCEIWEMEGDHDWRRDGEPADVEEEQLPKVAGLGSEALVAPIDTAESIASGALPAPEKTSSKRPRHYHISQKPNAEAAQVCDADWNKTLDSILMEPSSGRSHPVWAPSLLSVYGRQVPVPASTPCGFTLWSFAHLCSTNLGPADYISLASVYHTLVLDSVPILTLTKKNEARRFITLLDALYESRCRLLIRAECPPDGLFFPETDRLDAASGDSGRDSGRDAVYQETLAEIYQDRTSSFRPNISSYNDHSAMPTQAFLTTKMRSVLADEDAAFGPVYGNGRGHGAFVGGEAAERRQQVNKGPKGPDFTKTTALTGEDERFAYKRAKSRIWEMCGERWWRERPATKVDEWWRPIAAESRFWERRTSDAAVEKALAGDSVMVHGSHDGRADQGTANDVDEGGSLFKHGASPFRTRTDAPPKFGWQHAWGMMTWGRKAGEWGKGVEGRKGRDRGKEGGEDK